MSLSPGTRFGQYEIADEIGAGGMGLVYRATDTTLEREVAIKVLPESMAADAERISRFDREAKTLASLNHPNIATIHGLEKADGTTALVMELVEGPTLADRIEKGAIPADEALGIAMQIAEALEAAHGQNIVHRDLKPANIKLRPDGTVKVLDFGIAKALEPENVTTGGQSPMLTTPVTQVGVILGTAAYMSPEQARGKAVDERTDIWAFGCVLYEMLTGQPAFGGEDVPITLARVLANDTDMESLPNAISPAVRQAIQLCLQKDLRKRVADIRDVRLALEGAFDTVSPQAAEGVVVARSAWRRTLPVASATLVSGAILAGLTVWVSMQPEPRPVNRFDYELSEGQLFRFSGEPIMALSPDGRNFVYNTQDGLYLRTMGDLEARLIPGTEPILSTPVFAPDSQAIAYWDISGQLKRIGISGGAPVVIAEVSSNVYGLSWEADGTIFVGLPDGVYRVSANGGTPELVVEADFPYGPRLLPDEDSVLFNVTTTQNWDDSQIVVQSLSTSERTVLVEGGTDAHYFPTGHLVYALGDGLFAVAFDPDTLTVSGGTVPLVQGVMRTTGTTGASNYSVSDDGTLAYVIGSATAAQHTLVWVDREGREEPIGAPPRNYTSPRISPDGMRVALNPRDQEVDIWIWDLIRETLTRLTFDPGTDTFPVWSPDGLRIAFSSGRGGDRGGIYWRAADGSGLVERLAESGGQMFPSSFLPDATGIIFRGALTGAENDDIAIVSLDGGGDTTPLLQTTFRERNPELSPDGRWLAYASNESGREEIFVRGFPEVDAGGRWQVSTGGGLQPLWSRDGRELFYRSGDALLAVSIETDPTFIAGNAEVVFERQYANPQGGRTYDISPDGERFLMIKQVESASEASQIIVVQNWFEELKRLVPTE